MAADSTTPPTQYLASINYIILQKAIMEIMEIRKMFPIILYNSVRAVLTSTALSYLIHNHNGFATVVGLSSRSYFCAGLDTTTLSTTVLHTTASGQQNAGFSVIDGRRDFPRLWRAQQALSLIMWEERRTVLTEKKYMKKYPLNFQWKRLPHYVFQSSWGDMHKRIDTFDMWYYRWALRIRRTNRITDKYGGGGVWGKTLFNQVYRKAEIYSNLPYEKLLKILTRLTKRGVHIVNDF